MRMRLRPPQNTAWSRAVGTAAIAMALLGFAAQPALAQPDEGKSEPSKNEASKVENTPKAAAPEAKPETKDAAPATTKGAAGDTKNEAGKPASDSAHQGAKDAKQTDRDAASRRKDADRDADRATETKREPARRADEGKDVARDADRTSRDSAGEKDRDDRGAAQRERSSKTADDRRDRDDRRDGDDRSGKNSRAADDRGKSRENIGLTFSDKSRDRLTISDVARSGLAASIGFRTGDVIVSVDGRRVTSQSDFDRWVLGARSRLPIVVIRDDRQMTLYFDHVADANQSRGAYLGVVFDSRYPSEAVIQKVTPNSPAEEAGLQRGDAILSINGQNVGSSQDLIDEINNLSPGDKAELEISVGDTTDTVVATLGSRPGVSGQRHEVAKPPISSDYQPRTLAPAENNPIDNDRPARSGPRRDGVRNNR